MKLSGWIQNKILQFLYMHVQSALWHVYSRSLPSDSCWLLTSPEKGLNGVFSQSVYFLMAREICLGISPSESLDRTPAFQLNIIESIAMTSFPWSSNVRSLTPSPIPPGPYLFYLLFRGPICGFAHRLHHPMCLFPCFGSVFIMVYLSLTFCPQTVDALKHWCIN